MARIARCGLASHLAFPVSARKTYDGAIVDLVGKVPQSYSEFGTKVRATAGCCCGGGRVQWLCLRLYCAEYSVQIEGDEASFMFKYRN